jgi:hypothetical protein
VVGSKQRQPAGGPISGMARPCGMEACREATIGSLTKLCVYTQSNTQLRTQERVEVFYCRCSPVVAASVSGGRHEDLLASRHGDSCCHYQSTAPSWDSPQTGDHRQSKANRTEAMAERHAHRTTCPVVLFADRREDGHSRDTDHGT